MTDCLICFCPIEGQSYKCGDPKCEAKTCDECTISLINYSRSEQLIPKCTSQHCQSYYLWNTIKSLPKEAQTEYAMACLEYMLRDKGEDVKKQVEQQKILERLRKERMKFIQQSFPTAIAMVCQLTFQSKIKTLERNRSKKISEQMEASHRTCMNLYCNGHLTSDLKCMTCNTNFCKKCERPLPDNATNQNPLTHRCKEEDVESVKLIQDMTHCPKCHLPVFKDVGCDSITCANCGTRFLYSIGEAGGHGSSNAKIVLKERQQLSHIYREQLATRPQIMELLRLIEILEPKKVSEAPFYSLLRGLYKAKPTTSPTETTTRSTSGRTKLTFKKKSEEPAAEQPAEEQPAEQPAEEQPNQSENQTEEEPHSEPSTNMTESNEEREKTARKVAKHLNDFIINKYQIRRYQQALKQAEQLLRENKLNNRDFSLILEELEHDF